MVSHVIPALIIKPLQDFPSARIITNLPEIWQTVSDCSIRFGPNDQPFPAPRSRVACPAVLSVVLTKAEILTKADHPACCEHEGQADLSRHSALRDGGMPTRERSAPTSAWSCRHCLSRRSLGGGGSPALCPGCPRNSGANAVTTREIKTRRKSRF